MIRFIGDLKVWLAHRVQLTTDGHKAYLTAVENAFGGDIDYAMLVKLYGPAGGNGNERRYSAGECCGTIKGTVSGKPEQAYVSTSYVERQNLTMRMSMRRFTRLTNGFSKKAENHAHAVSLHFFAYNFVKAHGTLTKAHDVYYHHHAVGGLIHLHLGALAEVVAAFAGPHPASLTLPSSARPCP